MPDDVEKVLYCLHASRVERWHVEPVLQRENIGEHSMRVALWIILFHEAPSAELLRAAVIHDLEERTTGDIPHWTKHHYPELRMAASKIEAVVRREYLLGFELEDEDRIWLEGADLFDAWLHLWQEVHVRGNMFMRGDYERAMNSVFSKNERGQFPGNMYEVVRKLRERKM